MQFKCCVPSCTNVYRNGNANSTSFFKISADRKATWVTNIGRRELLDAKHSNAGIRGIHFEEHFFKNSTKSRLTSNAVPTLFLDALADAALVDDMNQSRCSTKTATCTGSVDVLVGDMSQSHEKTKNRRKCKQIINVQHL